MVTQLEIKNYWKEEDHIFLEEHEEVCPDCKGRGIIGAFRTEDVFLMLAGVEIEDTFQKPSSDSTVALVYCNRCGGEGKVDWIKRIRGSEII